MDGKYITLHTVSLNNNCPECFSREGLELTFKQRFKENRFYRSITKETIHQLNCKVCDTAIYPGRWTEDIDRVIDYHKKALQPKPTSFKLKKLSWILFITIDAIIILLLLFVFDIIKL